MINVQNIGNIELVKCLLALHYKIHCFYEELKDDPRVIKSWQDLNTLSSYFKTNKELEDFYSVLFLEAQRRGLRKQTLNRSLIYSDEFKTWQTKMFANPTYIREIDATNFQGDYDISFVDDEVMGFDYPVRRACKILNEKGYITYWSSANKNDFLSRRGQVVKNKTVAYILIDPNNLTEELKEKLILNGSCDFWGIAKNHEEKGNYYGIWTDIITLDTPCEEISQELANKALELPTLNLEIQAQLKI